MEDHTCNGPKQWISIAYHSQPEEETDSQKTILPTTTKQQTNKYIYIYM